MNMKRAVTILSAAALTVALAACGGPKAPQTLNLQEEAYLLQAPGDSVELAKEVVIEDEKASKDVTFTVDDPAVVSISAEGVLTAVAPGSARVTVASAVDGSVKDTAEVLVYDFSGVYTTEKYIDAMGCNVRVNLEVLPDGTFRYYRYPMNVNLDGGGLMEGFSDFGTYQTMGGSVHFVGDYFKDFNLKLHLDDQENALLTGKTPTGGATTDMEFVRNTREDRQEAGTYLGAGETQDGRVVSLRLEMEDGTYLLSADNSVISAGIYSFNGSETSFWAEIGVSFRAAYDADRQVVEGTEIPVSAELAEPAVAVTLVR